MRVLTLIATAALALTSLTSLATAGEHDRLERWVNIVNEGNASLVDVFITDVGTDEFGYDLMGGGFRLAGGDWTTIEPYMDRGYCKYDAKFVFADGSEAFLWDFNLCEALDIHVSEYGVEHVEYVG